MSDSSPFLLSPQEVFSTSFNDTKKLIQSCIAYLDRTDGNPLFGDTQALGIALNRESSENPTFWSKIGNQVVQLLATSAQDQPYAGLDVGVPVFNSAIMALDASLLDAERTHLWFNNGNPRRTPGRTPSAPPHDRSGAADMEVDGTEDDDQVPTPPLISVESSPLPRSAKGKDTPRQAHAKVVELAKAAAGLSAATLGAPSGNLLIDQRIQEIEANSLINGQYSTPKRIVRHSSAPTRPPPRLSPSPSTRLAPNPARSGPGDDSGSEDGFGLLPAALDEDGDVQLTVDDGQFVEELLAAPAEDCQLGATSSELGRAIASRAQAFRKLKKNTLREFVQRSNAPLPLDVREAIIRNEYIDFGKVLAYNPATTYTQPLGDASLQLVIEAPSPSRPVKSFTDWLDVFTKVVRYTLTAYPFRSDEFAAYSEWMRIRATRTPSLLSRYLEYDSNYRRHMGMLGYPDSLYGAPTHFDLLNEVVYHPDTSTSSSSVGTSSGPKSNKRSSSSVDPRDEYCRRWNSGTEHEGCHRIHRCSRCDSGEHDVRSCKKASGSGGGGGKKQGGNGGGAAGAAAGKSLRQ